MDQRTSLWLSDVGLVLTLAALLERQSPHRQHAAVGMLALELAWTIDFLAGGRLITIAAYMFDAKLPRYLRGLSLFHLALPPTLLFLVYQFGYDRRALTYQTLLTWAVLIVTYVTTNPEKNINWVFGPGSKPQHVVPRCFTSASKWQSFRSACFYRRICCWIASSEPGERLIGQRDHSPLRQISPSGRSSKSIALRRASMCAPAPRQSESNSACD